MGNQKLYKMLSTKFVMNAYSHILAYIIKWLISHYLAALWFLYYCLLVYTLKKVISARRKQLCIARFLWSCSVIHIMCVTWLERNRRVYGDYTGRKFKSLGHNFWSLDIWVFWQLNIFIPFFPSWKKKLIIKSLSL